MEDIEGRIVWAHNKIVEFSIKKLTRILIDGGNEESSFKFDKIWRIKVPS